MPDRGDRRPAGEGTSDFGSRLQELKERGCAVLVTGDAPPELHAGICRRLLGDASRRRHRLLVLANGTFELDTRLPGDGPGGGDTEVITTSATRSAAVQPASAPSVGVTELDDPALSDLGVAIVDAFRAVEERHGSLDPAELRFGLDSLSPLLSAHGEQAVFEFVAVLVGCVRAHGALGHVHLPVDRDGYEARLLASLFDAVVEVRTMDGRQQHRWHLDDGALTSRWLPI